MPLLFVKILIDYIRRVFSYCLRTAVIRRSPFHNNVSSSFFSFITTEYIHIYISANLFLLLFSLINPDSTSTHQCIQTRSLSKIKSLKDSHLLVIPTQNETKRAIPLQPKQNQETPAKKKKYVLQTHRHPRLQMLRPSNLRTSHRRHHILPARKPMRTIRIQESRRDNPGYMRRVRVEPARKTISSCAAE